MIARSYYAISTMMIVFWVVIAAYIMEHAPVRNHADYNNAARQCRFLIGLDQREAALGDSFKKAEMACVSVVIDQETSKGLLVSKAALIAYDKCMPKLDACDKALVER